MPASNLTQSLGRLIAEDAERLARRWAEAAVAEQSDRAALGSKELREPLVAYLRELGRILGSYGGEAPAIFGEAIRRLGGLRFEQRFGAADVVREVEALGAVLLEEWTRRGGALSIDIVVLVRELVAAATAGAVDDFVRRVRASRAHLREAGTIESIVKHVDEGLIAVERDGTISWASEPAARILGTTIEQLVGKRRDEVVRLLGALGVHDEGGGAFDDEDLPWSEAMAQRRASRARLLRLCRGGDERLVESDAIPIIEEGDLRGAVWTVRDRTDELRAREQLRKAYDELREMHVRLLRRTRSQALGEVAAQVAGALRNSMNTIRLRCQLAVESGVPASELEPIEATVDEMATLVTRLQDLAAVRKHDVEEAIPVDDVVKEALDLVRPELTAAAQGRELRVETALRSGAIVSGVRAEIREEIVHRLLDAMEAVASGGVISVATLRDGRKSVRVSVRATPPAETSPTYEDHLAVPIAGATSSTSAAPVEVRVPGRPARSVLVVDDDADNREMLAALLEAHGLDVAQAGTAAEARTLAATTTPDAALVDLAMPDASGWDVSRALRERHPDIRIALVTGYESAAASAMRPDGAVDAVIPKPVDVRRLLAFLGLSDDAAHAKESSP